MGRKLSYRPGSWYRTDDRSGFPTRAERTREEWTGLIVADNLWEARQPQDLVRGVKDDQSVAKPRPLPPPVYIGPIYQALADDAVIGQTVLEVESVAGFQNGSRVGVMLDSGVDFNTTLSAPPGAGTITLAAGLPYTAASGNLVTCYSHTVG